MSLNIDILSRSLDGLWLRQQMTMNNIANYSTPGYKSKFVDFESQLKEKIDSIESSENNVHSRIIEEINSSSIIVDENDNQSLRLDGNNVDLEKENLDLAKTQLQYMYTISEINSYFKKLNSVISEGK